MTIEPGDFIKLVIEMRAAQKNYYKQRTPSALMAAKEIEKKVDKAIEQAQYIADQMDRATRQQEEGTKQESLL